MGMPEKAGKGTDLNLRLGQAVRRIDRRADLDDLDLLLLQRPVDVLFGGDNLSGYCRNG